MPREAKIKYDVTGDVITLTFPREGGKTVTFDTAKANPEMRAKAMLHGFKQKLGDSAAGSEAGYADVQAVADRLLEGEWGKEREGGERRPTVILEALQRWFARKGRELTMPEVEAKWEGMGPDLQKKVRKSKDLIPIIADIRAERAKAKAESAEGLEDLLA